MNIEEKLCVGLYLGLFLVEVSMLGRLGVHRKCCQKMTWEEMAIVGSIDFVAWKFPNPWHGEEWTV